VLLRACLNYIGIDDFACTENGVLSPGPGCRTTLAIGSQFDGESRSTGFTTPTITSEMRISYPFLDYAVSALLQHAVYLVISEDQDWEDHFLETLWDHQFRLWKR
jgi:hypothetical protein